MNGPWHRTRKGEYYREKTLSCSPLVVPNNNDDNDADSDEKLFLPRMKKKTLIIPKIIDTFTDTFHTSGKDTSRFLTLV